ncbi:MAG: hypothetical protein AB7L92_06835 [Alphaproteobacteria bacterium]
MKQALLEELVANVVRVEITREHGADIAQLAIKNDVTINTELRNRGRRIHARSANAADSAHAVFRLMKEEIEKRGMAVSSEELVNLPKMERGATGFSATATIDVGTRSDEELRGVFQETLKAAKDRMSAARYRRFLENWSDKKGSAAADQGLGGL